MMKGTFSIGALITGTAISKYEGILYASGSNNTVYSNATSAHFLSDDIVEAKVLIAMSLSFFSGLFLVFIKISLQIKSLIFKFVYA